MMNNIEQTTNQIIAKEGMKPVLLSGVLILLCIFIHLNILALVFFIICLFFILIFRNPERIAEYRKENMIIAPCDGIVRDVYISNNKTTIKVEIGIFDVGVLRTPMFIDSINTIYKHGLFIKNDEKLKEILNTRHCINGIKNNNTIYSIKLLPEIWNKVNIYNTNLAFAGDRIGFMKYGFLFLTINVSCNIKIQKGDNIIAGQTLLGKLD